MANKKIEITQELVDLNPDTLKDAVLGEKVDITPELILPPTPPAGGGKDTGKDKKIEVSEKTLRELIDSNKKLQERVELLDSNAAATNNGGIQIRKKIQHSDFTLRKWNGKIVIGYENVGTEKRPMYVYQIYDEKERKMIDWVNLILLGEKNPVKVESIVFRRDAERIKARKISEIKTPDVQEFGYIPKKEMAENGYGMFETMVMVPVEVTTDTYKYTLQLPPDEGGGQIEVDSQAVNI